jgi:poly-gamma-glutamate capsule biosynthesis protein CapA/YwtB (metallophosphatase superfamily)
VVQGSEVTLFLCGDVMIGRGIDQIQARSVDPRLFEPSIVSAAEYVGLAEATHGPIPRSVAPSYVWGEALDEIDALRPDARIVNLETAVTTSPSAWPGKDIHYRTHPDNVAILRAARIDCCVLANNHVLDWGYAGLLETLDALHDNGVVTAGAGPDRLAAREPAVIRVAAGRVIVVGLGSTTSGIPEGWGATEDRPGVDVIADDGNSVAEHLAAQLMPVREPGDLVVASVHWGPNWGYEVAEGQRRLAHALIDTAGIDIVHGHSSHHPLGIEVYRGRLILYGCGDFITDYEGISGHSEYRNDLVIAYYPTFETATRRLVRLTLRPFRIRRFRLERPTPDEVDWLCDTLDRHSRPFGVQIERGDDGMLDVRGPT